MSISGGDDSNTTQVMTTSDHAEGSGVESDVLGDGAGLDVEDDGVVDLDVGVGVSDGSGVVGDDEWDTLEVELVFFRFSLSLTLAATPILVIRQSLYLPSSGVILWTANRPLTS